MNATPRFKDKDLNRIYGLMLALAADSTSELYHKGVQRRGGSHRCAFWDGYSGKYTLRGRGRAASVILGTMSHACFAAGRDFAKLKVNA